MAVSHLLSVFYNRRIDAANIQIFESPLNGTIEQIRDI